MKTQETFSDIFAVFEHLKSLGWPGLKHPTPSFEVMDMGNDELCAVPMPMQPLYRGQNRYYEKCEPTLYRRQWTPEELFERDIQLADFKYILNEHPEIKDRIKAGIKINYEGLAQHYGIPTDILDFTNSPLVAAFFATTRYDALKDTYSPILHLISKGVIYFNPMGGLLESNASNSSCTLPIGMEALHRPGEQRAYGRKMKRNEDLNTNDEYIKFFFWQNPRSSLRIWERCGGQLLLFPYDPMTEKVKNILKYRLYSVSALKEAYARHASIAPSLNDARDIMLGRGCNFVDFHPFAYTGKELEFINNELHLMYPDSY